MTNDPINEDRRPLNVRSSGTFQKMAAALARSGITPNQISVLSVVFAAAGAAVMFGGGYYFIVAALCIQARLLCNLFDGMVAVEHNKASTLGPVFNEFPDRIADSLLLVAAGYATGNSSLGWLAALAAALTAYVRTFGAACGNGHDFRGPMAKQQRMFVLTVTCLSVAFIGYQERVFYYALLLIGVLSIVTCVTRTLALCKALNAKAAA